ncbi:hypothetical protein R1sor_019222 [Riccia sorocarpa]|uniref:Reverse transcriptase zinc-binding domain-containing protein n=1 Tax=Riccia sorocarpa TaxID=122646 RepID=A0ABD3IFI7_9MARC
MGFQVRNMIKVITGNRTEWVHVARSLVLRTLRNGQYQRERAQWTAEDGLILMAIPKGKGSALLSRMIRSWNRIRNMLTWDETCRELPCHLTIMQNGNWRARLALSGFFLEEADVTRLETIEDWRNTEYVNEKWRAANSKEVWSTRWQKLWVAPVAYRRKIWIWKMVQWGIFTGSKRKTWSAEDKMCKWCGVPEETIDHALWDFQYLTRRKIELREVGLIPPICHTLLRWLDAALGRATDNTSWLTGFGLYMTQVWKERNDLRFRAQEIDALPDPASRSDGEE